MQACHAAHESGQQYQGSETLSLVLCKTNSEQSLLEQAQFLDSIGIEYILFREPDMENRATALSTLALNTRQRKFLSHWKLWS